MRVFEQALSRTRPNDHLSILSSRGEALSLLGVRHGVHRIFVAFQGVDGLTARRAQQENPTNGARNYLLSIRRQGDAKYR